MEGLLSAKTSRLVRQLVWFAKRAGAAAESRDVGKRLGGWLRP